jgi:ATP-dependent Lon protease
MKALGILFKYNLPEAMQMFFDFVKNDIGESIKLEYYSVYNNENGIKLIEPFYYLLYEENEKSDVFKYHHTKELYRYYLNAVSSKNYENFNLIQGILKKVKKKIKKNKKEVFYINILIEDSINSFINFKSKPLEFNDAKNKVENFKFYTAEVTRI